MCEEIDQVMSNAMQIIMAAGDARVNCQKALEAIEEFNIKSAKENIILADEKIAQAHHIQTDAIQGAVSGEEQAYSVLFSHAQDTLMCVYSEIHMTKQLLKIFSKLDERLKKIEQ